MCEVQFLVFFVNRCVQFVFVCVAIVLLIRNEVYFKLYFYDFLSLEKLVQWLLNFFFHHSLSMPVTRSTRKSTVALYFIKVLLEICEYILLKAKNESYVLAHREPTELECK